MGDIINTFGTPLGTGPADWQIYPGLNSGATSGGPTPSSAGVTITSLTPFQESGAASATAAITAVISALESQWDSVTPTTAGLLDYAGWFQYGGNTYIVNSDQGQNQVIELVGTYSLSSAAILTAAGTATITNITTSITH